MQTDSSSIRQILGNELSITQQQVDAFMSLYDEGNTVPFIARYRKEATSGLDDVQLRLLETRLIYLRELNTRRSAILKSLTEQKKLTSQLKNQIEACVNKTALELLYAPYKSKRVSKGTLAVEAGIEPLADKLWFHQEVDREQLSKKYIDASKGFK